MGIQSVINLWKADRSYFLMVVGVGFLPWMLSGAVGWFVSGYVVEAAGLPGFQWIFFPVTVFTMALGLTPTTLVATLAGFLFGWAAFPYIIGSYLAAAFLGRWLGVWLNRILTGSVSFSNPKADHLFTRLEARPFWLLLFCRLSPVLTFALTNVALGRMQFKMPVFLTATFLGMLPRTTLVFYTGTQAAIWSEAIRSGADPTLKIVLFVGFILISFGGIGILVKNALQRAYSSAPVRVETENRPDKTNHA